MRDLAVRQGSEGGFALLELFLGASILVVGSLALLTSLFTSAQSGRDARFRTLARNESLTLTEGFRGLCNTGFAAAVQAYAGREVPCQSIANGKSSATVRTEIALDETVLTPPMDLNGDGDALDATLTANELAIVCLTTRVSWQRGKRSDTFLSVLSRADVASPGDQTPGDPPPWYEGMPQFDLLSSNLTASALTLQFTSEEALPCAGMTIHSSINAYVKEIKVNGKSIFKKTTGMPPTGQVIVTTAFTTKVGTNKIDTITFAATPSGGTPNVSAADMSVVFHTEAGDHIIVVD